ncbi:hypothetical protein MW887_000315 [Aspergillus wentii]|nr:hypothetical protein MW887_000315 [Aspergillus wentii]
MAMRLQSRMNWAGRATIAVRGGYGGVASRLASIPQNVSGQGQSLYGAGRLDFGVRRMYSTGNVHDVTSEDGHASGETELQPENGGGEEAPVPVRTVWPKKQLDNSRPQNRTIPFNQLARSDQLLDIATNGAKVNRRKLAEELKWLPDPLSLAHRVGLLLKDHEVGFAAELIREAQKNQMNCLVAWNHLLEYCMEKDAQRAAFRFYNDMKKRGLRPNRATYTIMLHGLSKTGKPMGLDPVKTAVSIYRSISAPGSKVEPNIIHHNAMLVLCSRHGNMDMLWQIAGELPEDGATSPDATTYTIILDAIRGAIQRDVEKMEPHEVDRAYERKTQGIQEGKRVWFDVVHLWKNGQFTIDNHLVGAMCKLLMERGSEMDYYEVFALFNQTAGIPILARKPLTDTYNKQGRFQENQEEVEDVPFVDEGDRLLRRPDEEAEVPKEEEAEENFDNLFDPITTEDAPLKRKSFAPEADGIKSHDLFGAMWIPVGNTDLTMILNACVDMNQGLGSGKAYWQNITQEDHGYKVEPDHISANTYLRLLRRGRSSRIALELVRDQLLPIGQVTGKTIHIALSCCRRDRKNINVFKISNELLALMDTALALPDPRALEGYLSMIQILEENPQSLISLNGLEVEGRRSNNLAILGQKLQVTLQTTAIGLLRPHIAKLHEAITKSTAMPGASRGRLPKATQAHAVQGNLALKVMVRTRGLIDAILKPENASFISKTDRKQYEKESQQLRVYSNKESFRHLQDKMSRLIPTPEQILEFHEKNPLEMEAPEEKKPEDEKE